MAGPADEAPDPAPDDDADAPTPAPSPLAARPGGVAPPDEELDDALEAAWARAEAEWDDDDAHRKFIALCAGFGRLDAAGGRYRAVRESDPERAEVAKKQIDRIVAHAMATLQVTRTEPSERPRRSLLLAALVLMIGLLSIALWVWLDAQR